MVRIRSGSRATWRSSGPPLPVRRSYPPRSAWFGQLGPALRHHIALGILGLAILVPAILGVSAPGSAQAQEPPPEGTPATSDVASSEASSTPPESEKSTEARLPSDPEALRARLQQELDAIREAAGTDTETPDDAAQPGSEVSPAEARVRSMLALVSEWQSLLERQRRVREQIEAVLPEELSPLEPADVHIVRLAELIDRLETGRISAAIRDRAIERGELAVDFARTELDDRERARRAARSAVLAAEPEDRAPLELALEQRRLESRVALERRKLKEAELERDLKRRETDRSILEKLAGRIGELRSSIATSTNPRDLQALLAPRLETAERELETAEKAFTGAEQQRRRASSGGASSAQGPVALERLENLDTERDVRVQLRDLAKQRLDRLQASADLYARWREVLRGQLSREAMLALESDLERELTDLEQHEPLGQVRIDELEARIDEVEKRAQQLDADDPVRRVLEARVESLERELDGEQAELKDLERGIRLRDGILADVSSGSPLASFGDRWSEVLELVSEIWGYEIAVVDDDGITVGLGLLALVLLVIGFTSSRRISAAIGKVVVDRLSIDPGVAAAIETFGFYALLIAFTLFSLHMVSFPLTVFTLAGGALAIGIGFGSQNVMNNFISGLILMLERPVRARDLVDLDGTFGTVEKIGARSTIIRASDSTQLIVPNSFFLENQIVNWTLSDDVVRSRIAVGVAYGSPTRDVEKLVREALTRHTRVLKNPTPVILFADFGDNSLNFEAFFWMRARSPMQVRRVESELRFTIDDLFREAGIVIAFPQRDLHLDTARPLDVRLHHASSASEDAP